MLPLREACPTGVLSVTEILRDMGSGCLQGLAGEATALWLLRQQDKSLCPTD